MTYTANTSSDASTGMQLLPLLLQSYLCGLTWLFRWQASDERWEAALARLGEQLRFNGANLFPFAPHVSVFQMRSRLYITRISSSFCSTIRFRTAVNPLLCDAVFVKKTPWAIDKRRGNNSSLLRSSPAMSTGISWRTCWQGFFLPSLMPLR